MNFNIGDTVRFSAGSICSGNTFEAKNLGLERYVEGKSIQENSDNGVWRMCEGTVAAVKPSKQNIQYVYVGVQYEGYQYVLQQNSLELVIKNKTMKKIGIMMRKLLSPETQELVKAEYINGDLELTTEGREALMSILFTVHKEELVKLAKEKNKEIIK